MYSRTFLLLLGLMITFTSARAEADSGKSVLLICNKSDDTVSFVDSETFVVLGTTTTGRGPHEIAVTPDGRWGCVPNYEASESSISHIDVTAREELRKIPLAP